MSFKVTVDDARPAPEGWYLCRTNTEAIKVLLGSILVDAITLDHDITHRFKTHSGKVWKAECQETFMPVAYCLTLLPKNRRPRIVVIHTSNPRGAKAMKNLLTESGYDVSVQMLKKWGSRERPLLEAIRDG